MYSPSDDREMIRLFIDVRDLFLFIFLRCEIHFFIAIGIVL